MFPATDNPAQRLLEVLTAARSINSHTVSQVWQQVFGLAKMDAPTFYRIVGHLNYLVDSVETRIRQIDSINHELFLRDLPSIRKIVCPISLETPWNSLKGPLDTGALTGLEFCANELGKLHSEEKIPADDLRNIRTQFAELFQEVSNSTIPTEIKLILLDLITSSLIAIEQYQILGNDGLKKAVAYAVGVVTLHKEQFLASKTESLVKRVTGSLMSLGKLIAVAYKLKELENFAPDLLKLTQ